MNVTRVGSTASLAEILRAYMPGRSTREVAKTESTTSPTADTSSSGASIDLSAVIDLHVRFEIGDAARRGDGHGGRDPLRRQIEGLRREVVHAVKDAADELGPLTKDQKKELRTALREFAHEIRDAYREAVDSGKPLDPQGPLPDGIQKAFDTLVAALEKIFGGADGDEKPPVTILPVADPPKAIDEVVPATNESIVETTTTTTTTPAPVANTPDAVTKDPLAALPDLFRALLLNFETWLAGEHPSAPAEKNARPASAKYTFDFTMHAELTVDATA